MKRLILFIAMALLPVIGSAQIDEVARMAASVINLIFK